MERGRKLDPNEDTKNAEEEAATQGEVDSRPLEIVAEKG